jgi:hypothetical protein
MTTEVLPVAQVKRKGQSHLLTANTISVSRFHFPSGVLSLTHYSPLLSDWMRTLSLFFFFSFFPFPFCLFLEYTAWSDWTCFGASRRGFHDWKSQKRDGGII